MIRKRVQCRYAILPLEGFVINATTLGSIERFELAKQLRPLLLSQLQQRFRLPAQHLPHLK